MARTFIAILLLLILGGCNLGTAETDTPPTLMPRITEQPLPTLGYSTPVPDADNPQATSAVSSVPAGAQLYTLLNQVTNDSLMNTVSRLQGFGTRHVNSSSAVAGQGVRAAADWLYSEFQNIQQVSQGNFQTFAHPFVSNYNGVAAEQRNIVGIINGSLPNTQAIVIGAHYDSRTDDLTDANGFAPGADDNGSGVAALLEMARVLSLTRPRSTLIFVLFSAEEVDRQGSRRFVRDYIQGYNINVKVMINIDTVGSVNDSLGNVNDRELRIFSPPPDNGPSRQMARMVDFIVDNYGTDLKLVYVEAIDREGRFGDHFSFHEAGIPAVRIIEALEDNYRREGRDTIEYVEPDYLRKSTRTLITMALALSDGLPAPTNLVVRQMDDGVRRLIWEQVSGATGYIVALRRPGEVTYEQQFSAPSDITVFDCDCFVASRFVAVAVATINEQGIMGPLSAEVAIP